MAKRIILASGSPRRSELLTQIGIPFEVITSQQDEIYKSSNPCEIVQELAQMKASHVAKKLRTEIQKQKNEEQAKQERNGQEQNDQEQMNEKQTYQEKQPAEELLVIGADTIVVLEEEILEKPVDVEDAFVMINKLQGRPHQVYTGVALIKYDANDKEQLRLFTEETKVFVHSMSEQEIREYIAQGECFDKAGGYGIQGKFAAFIERIEGDYYNVMGLPLSRVYQEIKEWRAFFK